MKGVIKLIKCLECGYINSHAYLCRQASWPEIQGVSKLIKMHTPLTIDEYCEPTQALDYIKVLIVDPDMFSDNYIPILIDRYYDTMNILITGGFAD